MSRIAAACAVLVLGCGRLQFDARTDAALDASGDAGPDAFVCGETFCDRFDDRTSDLKGAWDDVFTTGTGTGTITNGTYVVSLLGTGDAVFLDKDLPAPASSVTFTATIGWSTTNVGTDCELDLVALQWLAGGCASPFGYYLVRDGTDPLNLQETNGNAGCTGNRNNYFTILDNTGPHDFKLIVVVGPIGTAKTVLYLDGMMIHERDALQAVPSAPFRLRLGGVIVRNGAAPWTITYENVAIDVD